MPGWYRSVRDGFACPMLLSMILGLSFNPVQAQMESPDELLKKQAATIEALVKFGPPQFTTVESADLRLVSVWPVDKAQKIVTDLQKSYTTATKSLGYDGKPDPIPGKLTLITFADSKLYKIFLLQALKRSPRGRAREERDLNATTPLVVINGAAQADKPTDASLTEQLAQATGMVLLNYKAGTTDESAGLPAWLEQSFGDLVYLRAEGPTANRWLQYKAKVKSLATKTRGTALQYRFIWGDGANQSAEAELVAQSFVEFLVFGPVADKFGTMIQTLKPTEENESPSFQQAMEAVELMPEETEQAWRRWVLTGK